MNKLRLLRFAMLVIAALTFAVSATGQFREATEAEYKERFDYAIRATNAEFPFLFLVTTEFFSDGEVIRKIEDREERQRPLVHRTVRTTTVSGREEVQYEISIGSAKLFCSDDGKVWRASENMCLGPVSFYGPESPLSVEYFIENRSIDGRETVRLCEITTLEPQIAGGPKRYRKTESELDSRGHFIIVRDTEGLLDPETITLIRTQVWSKEKFDEVTAPTSVN